MPVPISWLREYAELPAEVTARDVARALGFPESPGAVPGQVAVDLAQLRGDVLVVVVAPDRGSAASIRGVAREAATAFSGGFHGPAAALPPEETAGSYPASVADATA